MARPIKDGVDYFPKDTDFYSDDKVRLLRAEFGAKGMYVLDYILCDLYGKNGYFTKWDDNKCYLVSDGAGCGCTPSFIAELVSGCIRCSIFDKRVFDIYGVLTSAGIQRRYIRMFNSRDEIVINKEYWLLNEHDKKDVPASVFNKLTFFNNKTTENPFKSTENPFKSTGNSQSKVKDTNVSQSKVNNNICPELKAQDSNGEKVIDLILNDKSYHTVYQKEVEEFKALYPSVDIMQELRNMCGWLKNNPTKRKTKSGINRFVNSWLAKKQDKGGIYQTQTVSKPDYSDPHRYDNIKEMEDDEIDRIFGTD